MLKELKNIRDQDKDLVIIFSFLERVATKIVRLSVDYKTDKTITFIDYHDNAEYYIPFDKANRILDYCYSEYFFKIILSGSDFYQKVKKVCIEDLKIEPYIFDIFFRCLFLAIKDRFECETQNTPEFNKTIFYKIISDAPSEIFTDIPKVDHDYLYNKATIILKRLEDVGFIKYETNDITGDYRLQSYFAISCDTFRFFLSKDYGFESFSNVFEILDLKSYINSQSIIKSNLLKKLDKVIHMVILSSFDDKETRFFNNIYSDNSYIRQINKSRNKIRNQHIITVS